MWEGVEDAVRVNDIIKHFEMSGNIKPITLNSKFEPFEFSEIVPPVWMCSTKELDSGLRKLGSSLQSETSTSLKDSHTN